MISKGYLSVDCFFVLSGAVMSYVYSKSIADKSLSWPAFMWKRFARLYPVHFVTILLAIVILYVGPIVGFGAFPKYDFGKAVIFNTLALHGLGFLETLTLNYPSWSISAEFSAYAIFIPLALLVFRIPSRFSYPIGVLAFLLYVSLFESLRPTSWSPENGTMALTHLTIRYSFLRIWPEFLLGLLTMRHFSQLSILNVTQTTIALISVSFVGLFSLFMSWDIVFVLCASVLIGIIYIGNMPNIKSLHFLGIISYSLYMIHGLVEMVSFKMIEYIFGYGDNAVPLLFLPFVLAIAILAAYIVWATVEEPCRHFLTTRIEQPLSTKVSVLVNIIHF